MKSGFTNANKAAARVINYMVSKNLREVDDSCIIDLKKNKEHSKALRGLSTEQCCCTVKEWVHSYLVVEQTKAWKALNPTSFPPTSSRGHSSLGIAFDCLFPIDLIIAATLRRKALNLNELLEVARSTARHCHVEPIFDKQNKNNNFVARMFSRSANKDLLQKCFVGKVKSVGQLPNSNVLTESFLKTLDEFLLNNCLISNNYVGIEPPEVTTETNMFEELLTDLHSTDEEYFANHPEGIEMSDALDFYGGADDQFNTTMLNMNMVPVLEHVGDSAPLLTVEAAYVDGELEDSEVSIPEEVLLVVSSLEKTSVCGVKVVSTAISSCDFLQNCSLIEINAAENDREPEHAVEQFSPCDLPLNLSVSGSVHTVVREKQMWELEGEEMVDWSLDDDDEEEENENDLQAQCDNVNMNMCLTGFAEVDDKEEIDAYLASMCHLPLDPPPQDTADYVRSERFDFESSLLESMHATSSEVQQSFPHDETPRIVTPQTMDNDLLLVEPLSAASKKRKIVVVGNSERSCGYKSGFSGSCSQHRAPPSGNQYKHYGPDVSPQHRYSQSSSYNHYKPPQSCHFQCKK